ncbi:hypothetical protein [Caldivirga maquilingensis]|uniref:Uncharacterized protein n=1 Tax=Caldivirga maquilingensis (strain ATCC 700844 / DSM 13496 / JCM 10307 / IC-167) TaxID=397948 RepID=A8MB42_CALMQ|nr:hypothetical protein [Caldivirga maquilingensis]ABW02671.1 conserved hypothetical protein [Caldivirga maquilingensis IC-167]
MSEEGWQLPEDWEYSGGVPERILKLRAKCPYCGHVFELELAESWYNIGMSVACPKCGKEFSVSQYSEVLGEVKPKKQQAK